MTLAPEDMRDYQDDDGFVPRLLGLSDLPGGDIRLVLMPSFEPEEVWDISVDGDLKQTSTSESIWYSIPQRVKLDGASDWSYESEADFTPESVVSSSPISCPFSSESLRDLVSGYQEDQVCIADGITIKVLEYQSGQNLLRRIHSPSAGPLSDALIRICEAIESAGGSTSVSSYLNRA